MILRITARDVSDLMKKHRVTPGELAKRLHVERGFIDGMLRPANPLTALNEVLDPDLFDDVMRCIVRDPYEVRSITERRLQEHWERMHRLKILILDYEPWCQGLLKELGLPQSTLRAYLDNKRRMPRPVYAQIVRWLDEECPRRIDRAKERLEETVAELKAFCRPTW